MPGPWDDRVLLAEMSPHARIAAALRQAGSNVVRVSEGGHPGRTLTSTYHYDCGCRRTYKANQQTREEGEYLTPCEGHRDLTNLLTSSPDSPTMNGTRKENP